MSFENALRFWAGTDEETLENRSFRLEISHMLYPELTHEQLILLDDTYIKVLRDVGGAVGKALDELPPIMRPRVDFFAHAVAMQMSDIYKLVQMASVASANNGGQPLVPNPKKPDCTCANCIVAREVDAAMQMENNRVH